MIPLTRTRALAVGALLAGATAAVAVVPTFDGAAISEMATSSSHALKQIQQLRALGDSLVSVQESIGTVAEVREFKETLTAARAPGAFEAPDDDAETLALLARGGPLGAWEAEDAADRPAFETFDDALQWSADHLYTVGHAEAATGYERMSEIQQVHTFRAALTQKTALLAFAVAATVPASHQARADERVALTSALENARSLREDVAALAALTLADLDTRNERALLAATALELEALQALANTSPAISAQARERLGVPPAEAQ